MKATLHLFLIHSFTELIFIECLLCDRHQGYSSEEDLIKEIDIQTIGIYDTEEVQGMMGAYAGMPSPYHRRLPRDLEN